MVPSSPRSIISRAASPSRLVPPSTLRATYSHASLRSAAAPSLAHDSAIVAPSVPSPSPLPSPSTIPSLSSSSSPPADSFVLPESFATDSNVRVKSMVAATGPDINSESASTTQSSAASAAGSEKRDISGPPPTSAGLVVTGEIDAVDAGGVVDIVPGDAKQALREHLRRRLSDGTDAFPHGINTSRDPSANIPPVHELQHAPGDDFPQRHYFILTNAGKPVFISHEAQGNDDGDLTGAMGLMQALISVFADDGDKIRCINAGRTRISFLLRAPLYYACVSSWREPESVTRIHLDYVHQQILSIFTAAQLRRIFEKRNNFDLRRLLDGSEGFFFSLMTRLEQDFGLTTGSLAAVRLDSTLRAKVGELLVPPKENKNILYALLLSRPLSPRVITLARPKRQSIHPSDLHLLLNTLSSKSLSANAAASSSSWLPVCLPKYNSEGFLHVYVSFLGGGVSPSTTATGAQQQPKRREHRGGHRREQSASSEVSVNETAALEAEAPTTTYGSGPVIASPPADLDEVFLVIVTPQRDDFDKVHKWAGVIDESLRTGGLLKSLIPSCKRSEYSVNELAIPGLRHFMYKSRSHVQITSPIWDEPYYEMHNRNRLITLYQTVHDELHARSGQIQGPLKLQCIRTDKEIVMGWITQPFELLLALPPHLPKTAVVSAANAVAKWIKKEESKLFIRDAPVF